MKKTIIITSILLFVGCSAVSNTTPYNTPFINADETIQLYEGMTKNDVLNKVGHPLYVKSGINNTIVWIYEVRSIEVQSETEAITQKVILKKSNSNKRNSDPIHRMEIVFINNKVDKWGMIEKEQKLNPKKEKLKPKNKVDKKDKSKKKTKKEKTSWTISPALWILNSNDDMGLGFGAGFYKGNLGFQLDYNSTEMDEEEEGYGGETSYGYKKSIAYQSFNWMVVYNKEFENFTTSFGVGQSRIRSQVQDLEQLQYNSYVDTSGSGNSSEFLMRVGIGKHLSYRNINFTPMLEMNVFNEEVGFSVMTRFNF